jgi:hypothetical protein
VIFEGFMAKGIAEADIRPRENEQFRYRSEGLKQLYNQYPASGSAARYCASVEMSRPSSVRLKQES